MSSAVQGKTEQQHSKHPYVDVKQLVIKERELITVLGCFFFQLN